MKKLIKKGICLLLILLMILPTVNVFAKTEDIPTVFIIGDSTAATYSEARAPRTGWGQVLHNFFKDGYMVKNYAQSGASAHSCYDSFWQTVKRQIKSGDYLLIQFGHNDSAKSGYDDEGNTIDSLYRWGDPTLGSNVAPPEGELTNNSNDYSYKWYLKQFADYAEDIGAHPIFVTSVERRDHAIGREEDADSGLYPWVKAMKDLATDELNIPVIDVWTEVRTLVKGMEQVKENSTKELYMHLQPGEYAYYPDGAEDNTHLSLKGALKVAGIFAKLLKTTDIPLKHHLVDDVDSVTANKILPEKVDEDFYGAEIGIIKSGENYNSWYVSGSADNTPYVQVVYDEEDDTNKVINFYRDGTKNTGSDGSTMDTKYILKNPLGADSADAVENEERYVRLKYRFRSAVGGAGFNVILSGFTVGVTPSSSRLFFGSSNNQYIDSKNGLDTSKWYEYEIYCDLKLGKATLIIDNNRYYQSVDFGRNKIAEVKIQPSRCTPDNLSKNENRTWSYFVDDIELSTIDEDTYCDYVGVLPDETYVMKETYNIYDEGRITTGTWNGWNIGVPTNAVSMVQITDDPTAPSSSNKTLAFQRTGVPSSANKMEKTLDEVITDGYVKLKFGLLKHNDNDNLFELNVFDSSNKYWTVTFNLSTGTISTVRRNGESFTTSSASFDNVASGYSITKDVWYNFEFIYDLTGDNGALTAYVNGRKLFDNIEAVITSNVSGRHNNGTIKKISIGLNRTDGSKIKQTQEITDSEGKTKVIEITNVDYSGNGTLIADVRLDNLELKYAATEPLALIYSNDATKVSGVKIKNERVAKANEKMMVAVYSNDTVPVLKGVSECEAITYGKTELSLKTPLSVNQGDKIKIFFWDMQSLLPKGYLETTK